MTLSFVLESQVVWCEHVNKTQELKNVSDEIIKGIYISEDSIFWATFTENKCGRQTHNQI